MRKAPPATVILVPASGPKVGGGHVMRCLSLGRSLQRLGADCAFVVSAYGAGLVRRFSPQQTVVHEDLDAAMSALSPRPNVVVDDYIRSYEIETRLRPYARRILAIDDLADRRHDADLLLDAGYGRAETDYAGLVPKTATLLLGPRFALLRPDFAPLRATALSRPTPAAPARIFISFGLSDVGGIAARAAALTLGFDPIVEIDLALASDAQSLPALTELAQSNRRLSLHVDATDVETLISRCDLAIGAGGSSTFERMCLGRPTLAVAVADNQRVLLRRLREDGLLIATDIEDAGFDAAFIRALDHLWPAEIRSALCARSASVCDGLGADRAAQALLEP